MEMMLRLRFSPSLHNKCLVRNCVLTLGAHVALANLREDSINLS